MYYCARVAVVALRSYYCAQAVEAARDWECSEQQKQVEVELHVQVCLVVGVAQGHYGRVYSEVVVQERYVLV